MREQRETPSRADEVAAIERQLLDLYADPTLDTKPELLQKRGGAYYSEAAVDLVASLAGDGGDVQVVDVRNNGTLPFLPDEAVVEVPAHIGADGAQPVDGRAPRPDVRRAGGARCGVRGAGPGRGTARRT